MKKSSTKRSVENYRVKAGLLVLKLLIVLTFFSVTNAGASISNAAFILSGKVTDDRGNPISGASIIEKGTSNGTITNESGTFTITVKNGNAVLVISHLGYTTQEIGVGTKTSLPIVLKQSESNLNEVVVVGYGTQRKATLTGAIASINTDQIVTTKNEAVLNALSGKLPGAIIVQNSAQPGTYDNTFNIRGLGGTPLIVIDGVIQRDASVFYRLNPNDIESISILKDASAAVYGFRSANGVVLVTTKKGESGKFALEYTGTYGFQNRSGVPTMADPVQYMTIANQMAQRAGGPASGLVRSFSDSMINLYRNGTLTGTDWINMTMLKNAPETQHTLSASGGNDRVTFYSSLSYLYQDGLFKNNALKYNKYSLTNNISANLTNNLKIKFNLDAIADDRHQPYVDVNNFFYTAWNMNPIQTPYWDDAKQYPQQSWLDYGWNPLILMDPNKVGYKQFNNLYANGLIDITYDAPFLNGLQISFTGSYDYSNSDNNFYSKTYSLYADTSATYLQNNPKGNVQQSPSTITRQYFVTKQWMTRLKAEYRNSFGGHNVDAMVLTEQTESKGDNFNGQRDLVLTVPYLFAGVMNADNNASMNGGYPYNWVNRAFVGRLSYDYKSKYLAEVSFRYDGSSKFISSDQWGFFPVASVGWKISDEKFFKNAQFLSFVDNLKFRASYGVLGDDGSAAYQFLTGYYYPATGGLGYTLNPQYLPAGSVFDGQFISASQNKGIANPNLTWLTSKTFNVGIDYSMWKGLLGITADYFVRNRSGLLGTRSAALPGIVGASLPQENLNSDQAHGFELTLSHHSTFGKFVLDASVNGSYTRNYWKRRPGDATQTNSYNNWRNNLVGRPTDVAFMEQTAGQYQSWSQILNSPWYVPNGTLPGDYYYTDYAGIGEQSSANSTYNYGTFLINAKGAYPLVNFGSSIGLGYQNFDLSMVWQGATMRYLQLPGDFTRFSVGQAKGNGIADFINAWHPADADADPYDVTQQWVSGHYPMNGNAIPTTTTSYYINGSYLRLKSIEFGYSLPSNLLERTGINSARVFINAYNIWTLQKAPKSMDPEHPGNNGEASGYAYPLNKEMSFGLDLKF